MTRYIYLVPTHHLQNRVRFHLVRTGLFLITLFGACWFAAKQIVLQMTTHSAIHALLGWPLALLAVACLLLFVINFARYLDFRGKYRRRVSAIRARETKQFRTVQLRLVRSDERVEPFVTNMNAVSISS